MIKINYYNEIKETLVKNEIYKKVKDYSKNKSDLNAYFENLEKDILIPT